jgi:hypothetical protein
MAKSAITTTKNYKLFMFSDENRPLNLKKRKRLMESMKRYGFLRSFPISCYRSNGKIVVKDGQHRLAVAEELGLSVHYYVDDVDYDVAFVNGCQEKWTVRDYAMKHANAGIKPYQDGLEFSDRYGLPIGVTFALLAGTTTFANIQPAFVDGTFTIKDIGYASTVASTYRALIDLSPDIKNARLMEACMAVCRVPKFDATRLLTGAKRCRDKLVAYSTRDAYLELLETVYNFGRKELVPLKIEAINAMRKRSPVLKPPKK